MKKTAPKKSPPAKEDPEDNYIDLPKDFEDPKVDVGETFEAVAEIRRDKDGYCVISLDGVPMDAEKDEAGTDDEGDDGASSESLGAGAKKMMGDY